MRTLNQIIQFDFPSLIGLPTDRGNESIEENSFLTNRLKWIAYLIQPHLEKERDKLGSGVKCCCLGHGCAVLLTPEEWKSDDSVSPRFAKMVGLHDSAGSTIVGLFHGVECLSQLNDNSAATPQEIGEMLLEVVRGGDRTPFIEIA